MTFGLTYSFDSELFLRIILSGLLGAMIGLERSRRFKEAGIRTHCVVACGAALMMVVSKYGFSDLSSASGELLYGTKGADPSRIASQVISGISFLGAGVIFKTGTSVKGLTTAAGIWATAAIGLAIGAGMYLLGIFTAIYIVGAQYLTHHFHLGSDVHNVQELSITFKDSTEFRKRVFELLNERHCTLDSLSTHRSKSGNMTYQMIVRTKDPITTKDMQKLMEENPEIKGFSV